MSNPKMNPPHTKNLEEALKDLNSAISKPTNEQDLSSREELENTTKDLLIKLREQLNDLSKD
jgi:hypothetical protein